MRTKRRNSKRTAPKFVASVQTIADRFRAARERLGYTMVERQDGAIEWSRNAVVMTAGQVRALVPVLTEARASVTSATDPTQARGKRFSSLLRMLDTIPDHAPIPDDLAIPAVRLLAEIAAANQEG